MIFYGLPSDRFDVRHIGRIGVRHDGGGVAVDQNGTVAFGF